MTTAMGLARRRGTGLLVVPAAVVIIALAFALGRAEASGDEYGDSASSTDGIEGDIADVLGVPDGAIVQIGTADSGGAGSLTVMFDNNVAYDGTGDDVLVHVVDADFPATATIEVSADGVTWVVVGDFLDTADVGIDLGALGLDYAVAVRITQVSGDLPGFDVDAIEALNQIDLEDAALVATPETDENPGLTDHTVTANLTDAALAVEGAVVSFLVTAGPNSGDAWTDDTDAAGDATFTYTGDGGTGLDAITAWLDINGNGVPDAGEPSDLVTKLWNGVTGTIDLTDLDGGGAVVGDTLRVEVDDADLDVTAGADVVTVMVTSSGDPSAGLTALVLTETGDSTGIFQGTLTLVDTLTSEAAAELLAAAGDTITASYDDAFDGNGDDPPAVTDTLDVTDVETDDSEGVEKVTVCHLPGGNPGNAHALTVGAPAVPAHLDHGDTLGECDDDLPPTKRFEQLSSFCDRNPDHKRCGDLDSTAEGSANVEVDDGDSDDADGQLADFCERKPDHQRCGDGDSAGAASQGAVQQGDGDASGDEAELDSESDAQQLAAFCERKPDHKRCEGLSD